jgi:hypothetical protein
VSVTVLAVSTAVFVWAMASNVMVGHPEVRLNAWHHFYLGLILAAVGGARRNLWVLGLAAVIAADDAWQHALHVLGDAGYASPLRRLYGAFLWPLAPVRWVTGVLDGLFG